MDDTRAIWNYSKDLNNFLAYISGIHPNIQFKMEEEGGQLPFLDGLVMKKSLWGLG